jgi:hypothetical protein
MLLPIPPTLRPAGSLSRPEATFVSLREPKRVRAGLGVETLNGLGGLSAGRSR